MDTTIDSEPLVIGLERPIAVILSSKLVISSGALPSWLRKRDVSGQCTFFLREGDFRDLYTKV